MRTVLPGRAIAAFVRFTPSSLLIIALGIMPAARAEEAPQAHPGLIELSVEELMNVPVTLASKKQQKLSESAAAVYVITKDDIRRSGMSTIPELLRMVPGLNVAQFNANQWAISSRGFNSQYANKLLVMIDGRTIYSSTFSGVFWDVQDTLLEDIERIEVIRGPGGTLWGANAVNGVINVITKSAQDTKGGLMAGQTGTRERNEESFRYGGKLVETGSYRVYAKHFDRNAFGAADQWNQARGGFRADLTPQAGDALTLQGESYSGHSGQEYVEPSLASPYTSSFPDSVRVDGSFLRAKWQRALDLDDSLSLQFYYDHTNRQSATLGGKNDTCDLDFQHRFHWGASHEMVWGLDYRWTQDDTTSSSFLSSFFPASSTLNFYSVFAQDESLWLNNRFHVIVGSKFEHNDYTGLESQPNLRLLWETSDTSSLWAAASRAVHTPSRSETGINIAVNATPTGAPLPYPQVALATFMGNPNVVPERLTAYELGFRNKPRRDFFFDSTLFYNEYKNIVTHETGAPYPNDPLQPAYLIVPLLTDNKSSGHVFGAEVAANWQATDYWRLSGSVSLLRMVLVSDGSNDTTIAQTANGDPGHQWQLHSNFDLAQNVNLDAAVYHVSALSSQNVPAYTRFDLRMGWQPRRDIDLSLSAQNLTNRRHTEILASPVVRGSEVPRAVYGKITWRF